MTGLKISLWAAAAMFTLAFAPLLAPHWMTEELLPLFGMEPPAMTPLVEYAVRAASGCLVALGFLYAKLALHPRRYGSMVPLAGDVMVFIGFVCLGAGFVAGMPNYWFLCDFALPAAAGAAILSFSPGARARR